MSWWRRHRAARDLADAASTLAMELNLYLPAATVVEDRFLSALATYRRLR